MAAGQPVEARDASRRQRPPRRGDVAGHGAQQDLERLFLWYVGQLERDQTAGELFEPDYPRLAEARPFVEDLAQRDIGGLEVTRPSLNDSASSPADTEAGMQTAATRTATPR